MHWRMGLGRWCGTTRCLVDMHCCGAHANLWVRRVIVSARLHTRLPVVVTACVCGDGGSRWVTSGNFRGRWFQCPCVRPPVAVPPPPVCHPPLCKPPLAPPPPPSPGPPDGQGAPGPLPQQLGLPQAGVQAGGATGEAQGGGSDAGVEPGRRSFKWVAQVQVCRG